MLHWISGISIIVIVIVFFLKMVVVVIFFCTLVVSDNKFKLYITRQKIC